MECGIDSGLFTPQLSAFSIVESLTDDDRALLSSYGEFLSFQPGQPIFEEGQNIEVLTLMVSGRVLLSRKHEAGTITLGYAEAGDCLGEVNLFNPGVAVSTATAEEFTQVWQITAQNLEEFLAVNPVAGGNLLVGLAVRLSTQLAQMHECLIRAQLATLSATYLA